jgi:arsenate reductase-like glutaredoxin family protein
LSVKPIAPTELRRFTSRGAGAVIDENSRAFHDGGLAYLRLDDDEMFDRLLADQRLIKLPLVRSSNAIAVGVDEKAWKEMLTTR